MRVERSEVEFTADQEDDRADGRQPAIAACFALAAWNNPFSDSRKPLVIRLRAQATMPSGWLRIIRATSFMGSTFERPRRDSGIEGV
jgi:hypothetical protein